MRLSRSFRALAVCLLALAVASVYPQATTAPQLLPFEQDWSTTGQLSVNNNWNDVAGIVGYRGDGMTSSTGTNPQTVVADGSATPLNVTVNRTTPNTETAGGIIEFEGAN